MSEWTHKNGVDGIRRQAQELIEQAYQRGYKAGQENALVVDSDKYREEGRNEAWEVAGKIILDVLDGGMSGDELESIFGCQGYYKNLLKTYNASEAIAKIKAYEERKKQQHEAD